MTMWDVVYLDSIKAAEKGSLVSGPFGSNIGSRFFVAEGVPVIRGNNLTLGRERFLDDGFVFVSDAKARELRNCVAMHDDLVFTAAGTLGQLGLIPKEGRFERYIISNKQIRLRLDQSKCLPLFAYYYLSSPPMRAFIESQNKGSSVPLLTLGIVRKLHIRLPPLKVQARIAAVLLAYDDLMENNLRRIALLERMAEQLYREWFVRFRFPGHEHTKFVKGFPVDWRVGKLSELADINAHSIAKNREPESIRYLDISAVTTNTVETSTPISFRDAPGRARRCVMHGDMIWSSVRPANRAYCLILEPPKNLIASTGFAVISHREGVPFSFIKFVTTTDAFVEQMTAVAKGSAYPATSFGDFENAKLLVPPSDLLIKFDRLVLPMLTLAHRLGRQNEVLKASRDLLLPRLISGKLRVDDLDIQFPPSMQDEHP